MSRFCAVWLFAFLILFTTSPIEAQEINTSSSKLPPLFSTSFGIQHGFIFAHSPLVENTKGAHPTGLEFSLGWQRNDPATWNLCNCYPRSGILISYNDYDTRILGKSFNAAWFLEPNYKLGKNNFFFFKGAAGLSYLTSPFDSIKNPTNMSYSATVSGYLLVGMGLWFRINDRWWVNGSINYQHISNGGLKQPNKGINWPTFGMAVKYQKDTRAYYTGQRNNDKAWKKNPPRYDFTLFGIAKKGSDMLGRRKRLPLLGVGVQAAKQVGRINMLTLSTEVWHDAALENQLKRDSIGASAVKVGIAIGHEFILGKFLFTQRIGVYVFDQTPYYDPIYHRWGIHYRMNKNWGVGINLLAHRQVADFIDLRISYSL